MTNENTNLTNTNETTWLWPCPYRFNNQWEASRGYYLNASGLPEDHKGVDILTTDGKSYGMPVVASKSGTIKKIMTGCYNHDSKDDETECASDTSCDCINRRDYPGYMTCNYTFGNAIIIEHDGDDENEHYYSQYLHLSEIVKDLKVNDNVERGEVIGYIGSTGESSVPHLHFSLCDGYNESSYSGDRFNNNPLEDVIYTMSLASMYGSAYSEFNYIGSMEYDFNISLIESPYDLNGGAWDDTEPETEPEKTRYNLIRSRCSEDFIRDKNFLVRVGGTAKIRSDEPNPPSSEYKFAGWLCKVNGVARDGLYQASGTIDGLGTSTNVTLTAQWTRKTVNVTYDPNGGNWGGNDPSGSISVNNGKIALSTAKPSKIGFNFAGWRYGNTDLAVNATELAVPDGVTQITLEAKWEYTVTYELKDGAWSPSNYDPDGTYDATVTASVDSKFPTRTGYTFDGWQVNDSNVILVPGQQLQTVQNTTLHDKWTPNEYTVTYDIDNGLPDSANVIMAETSRKVRYGSDFSEVYDSTAGTWQTDVGLPFPQNNGKYLFCGWYLNADGTGSSVSDSTTVNVSNIPALADNAVSSITLYAKWVYQVTYDLNGGAWETEDHENGGVYAPSTRVNVYGDIPVRTGYHFKGWIMNDSSTICLPDAVLTPENTSLTARWEEMVAVIKYDTAGLVDASEERVTYSDTVDGRIAVWPTTLSGAMYCDGWQIKNSDDETPYGTEGNEYLPEFKSYYLAALNPRAASCTVSYNLDITDGSDDPSNVNVATSEDMYINVPYVIQKAIPKRSGGYSFMCWADSEGNQYSAGMKIESYAPLSLKAQWGSGLFSVQFDTGVAADDNLPAYDPPLVIASFPGSADITLPTEAPVRYGYTFMGWKTDNPYFGENGRIYQPGEVITLGPTLDIFDPNGENLVTYTAQWQPIPIWVNFFESDDPNMLSIDSRTVQLYDIYGNILDASGEKAYAPFMTPEERTYSEFLGWTNGNGITTEQTVVTNTSDHPLASVRTETAPYYDVYAKDGVPAAGITAEELKGIAWCKHKGFMTGTAGNDGNIYFYPDNTMTRAQTAVTLYRIAGAPACGSNAFFDVTRSDWYNTAVSWCADNGIMNGTSDVLFSPNDRITRAQFATVLYRLCGLLAPEKQEIVCGVCDDCSVCDRFAQGGCPMASFTDVNSESVSSHYRAGLVWAKANGIMNGTSDAKFSTEADLTRAQCAIILKRFFEYIY